MAAQPIHLKQLEQVVARYDRDQNGLDRSEMARISLDYMQLNDRDAQNISAFMNKLVGGGDYGNGSMIYGLDVNGDQRVDMQEFQRLALFDVPQADSQRFDPLVGLTSQLITLDDVMLALPYESHSGTMTFPPELAFIAGPNNPSQFFSELPVAPIPFRVIVIV